MIERIWLLGGSSPEQPGFRDGQCCAHMAPYDILLSAKRGIAAVET